MDDLISRQAAIEAINCDITIVGKRNAEVVAETIALFVDRIKALPPAQPERQKGKWIKNDNGTYSCSVCQSWIPEEQHHYARYCLYCGADMRGEKDG